MAKTCTKTFIKRGQEIEKKELKSNGTYAVRYTLPVEVAGEWHTTQEQWGVVMLLDDMVAVAWNVDSHNAISVGELKKPWSQNLTYFRSTEMERKLMQTFVDRVEDCHKYDKKMQEYECRIDNLDANFRRILEHPFHKIAENLRIFFS